MPENDVTKMKVADLKRELKVRGLATTGNKNELVDRLQTALIDGELSLEDTAISGEDLLDETVLTDEDESKILGADENDLLKSPTNSLKISTSAANDALVDEDAVLASPTTPTSKKIVLKRKSSITGPSSDATSTTTKENTAPTPAKLKMSERNPIVIGDAAAKLNASEETGSAAVAKQVAKLTMQERLEMRAKKFGLNANSTASSGGSSSTTPVVVIDDTPSVSNEKQMELLKKRADRFGVAIAPKIAQIESQEKLQKRKERFGITTNAASTNSSSSSGAKNNDWSEKARMRLERFKTTAASGATVPAAAATTAK